MTATVCLCNGGCDRCEPPAPPSEPVAVLFIDTTDSHEKGCACDTCIEGRAREAGDKVCRCGHSEYDHDLDHCLACPGDARCEEYRPRGSETVSLIADECDAIKALLLAKNKAYGDSAISPLRIFSKASPEEQIRVRIDDKLSRLARGAAAGEDTEQDLIGYLVLLRVERRMRGQQ